MIREAEERRKQDEHWKEQCIILDSEVRRLAGELEKAEHAAKNSRSSFGASFSSMRNFEIDDTYRQDI